MADPGSIGSAMLPGEDTRGRDIADIKRDVRELGPSIARSFAPVIASLTAQQATLADQQAQLTAQVATLAAQVALQISPASSHNGSSSYSLNTSAQELTRVTFTVPSGYTRALVFATTNLSVANQHNTLLDLLRGYVDIAGSFTSAPAPVMVDPLHTANVNSSGTSLLSGLAGGGTFYVRTVAYNQYGYTGAASALNVCNLDAHVIFLR